MECKITYINPGNRRAFTLVEVMVAMGLSVIIGTAIGLLAFYSARSFVAMTNHTKMTQQSQLALDKMSRDIRQARALTAYATNSLTFQDVNGNNLAYTFDSTARTLVRVRSGVTNLYLTNCDSLQFWIYQHTVISNAFDCYTTAGVSNARVIQVTWTCSSPILGNAKATTDSSESAEFVLRNH